LNPDQTPNARPFAPSTDDLPLRMPPRPPPAERFDIYDRVTGRIVELLEAGGPLPWVKPWHAEHLAGRVSRPLRHTGEPYHGINVLVLWLTAEEKGYTSPLWVTYNQARELGGHVRKGEQGTPVVYAGKLTKEHEKADGTTEDKEVFFLRSYTVFNAGQTENLPARYYALQPVPGQAGRPERLPGVEAFFQALGPKVVHGGDRAYYAVTADAVHMPPLDAFRDAVAYYATLAHEVTHWTAHPDRVNRVVDSRRFGSDSYAVEELAAELGAAFLCADLGLAPEPRLETAAYLQNWLGVLKADKRAIFTAAAAAHRAVAWMHGRQPGTGPEVLGPGVATPRAGA